MRLLTFSFLGAYLTADFDGLRGVHIALGYTMLGLLGFRIVWGLIGPKHVRFKLLFGKFSGVRGWWTATRQAPSLWSIDWKRGQNMLMAFAVLSLLVLVLPLVGSGYLVNNEFGGKLLESTHEFFGELYLWVVVSHISLIGGGRLKSVRTSLYCPVRAKPKDQHEFLCELRYQKRY